LRRFLTSSSNSDDDDEDDDDETTSTCVRSVKTTLPSLVRSEAVLADLERMAVLVNQLRVLVTLTMRQHLLTMFDSLGSGSLDSVKIDQSYFSYIFSCWIRHLRHKPLKPKYKIPGIIEALTHVHQHCPAAILTAEPLHWRQSLLTRLAELAARQLASNTRTHAKSHMGRALDYLETAHVYSIMEDQDFKNKKNTFKQYKQNLAELAPDVATSLVNYKEQVLQLEATFAKNKGSDYDDDEE
jgi:hypothetical protein